MAAKAISCLAVFLLVFSSRALSQTPAREALAALNGIPALGLTSADFGRFFDAGGPRWVRNADAIVPQSIERRRGAAPPPRLTTRRETHRYDDLIRSYAGKKDLDPRLVKSVIAAESEFTAHARSPAGALGLMQVMPGTAGSMGENARALFDPEANIRAGTAYLAYLFQRAWIRYHLKGVSYTRAPAWLLQRIVAAYNAGPRFLARRRLYRQTRDYVRKVLLFYRSAVTELRAAA